MKVECLNCQTMFDKISSQVKKSNNHFCSRSCSCSYTNKNKPRRKLNTKHCKTCGEEIHRTTYKDQRNYCSRKCFPNSFIDWDTMTYGQLKELKGSIYSNTRIREMARKTYIESDKPKECCVCGYDKHFEVCHIDGISSHNNWTKLSDINDIENLIAMCPNHHWELDYGTLTMFDIYF